MPIRATAVVIVSAALVSLACGCASQSAYDQLHEQFLASQTQVEKLTADNNALISDAAAAKRQIATLQALGEKRLDRLYHVERLEIHRHSGGVDLDGKAGSDAVRVHLCPIDQHGSVIKAAGSVRVQLFDLAADGEKLVGAQAWEVDELAKAWHDLAISNYSLTCKWLSDAPANDEITVRVEFTEYITGRTLTAQRLCRIKLPAAK